MVELTKQIDANHDGILTLDEWQTCLNPKLDAQKEYRMIM